MSIQVFESVWDALEDTPTEAENMKLRSSLMIAISEAVSAWHVTQMDAARRLGVTQPRLNDLLRGRVGKFSVDALVALASSARRPGSAFGNHLSRIARRTGIANWLPHVICPARSVSRSQDERNT
jgi:predicted XRE-type DNA-binding protein